MKLSEEYKVSGNVGETNVNGKVNVYPGNFGGVSRKAVVTGFRTSLKELKRKFGTISIYDKKKTIKAVSLILAGAITITSMTGCSLGKKADVIDIDHGQAETVIEEETRRIEYTVEFGDSLWSIAKKYCDTDGEIASEIKNICKINGLKENSVLNANTIIKLDVPVSKLINFGIIDEEKTTSPSEQTQRISYTVKSGDTLWLVAQLYCSNEIDIKNEVEHICEINGLSSEVKLKEGDTLLLDVPVSKLSDFGEVEVAPSVKPKDEYELLDDEWESKSQFIYDSWTKAKEHVHPQNYMFQRDYEYMFETYSSSNDGGLFHIAYAEREKLKEMLDIKELYSEESIKNKIALINDLYNQQFEITERNLGKNYSESAYIKGM